MTTEISNSLYQSLRTRFEAFTPTPSAVDERRRIAFERFSNTGFPGPKHEEWRYTNHQPVIQAHYSIESEKPSVPIVPEAGKINGLDALEIISINGRLQMSVGSLGKHLGLHVLPFHEAVAHPIFIKHFAQYADKAASAFVDVNTALAQNGFFVYLEKGTRLAKPIHIIHIATAKEPVFYQSRNLIVLDANAEAEIIESFISQEGTADSLSNSVTEIFVEEQAHLEHYYVHQTAAASKFINHAEIIQRRHSLYNHYNCNLPGASFIRNTIQVRLEDQDVESHLYGINLTSAHQLVDNHTVVDHMFPHCESYEWYKNIIQEESTVVFNGKIFVREDAQKTNAFQQNNNMLFGDQATIYTKPQLEIFADDVKCSHGCTIGQFDDEALFYLQSRGIGSDQAKVLLVHAFAYDVTDRFKNSIVKAHVDHLIEEGLILNEKSLHLQP